MDFSASGTRDVSGYGELARPQVRERDSTPITVDTGWEVMCKFLPPRASQMEEETNTLRS
jgi:hypothetical protein